MVSLCLSGDFQVEDTLEGVEPCLADIEAEVERLAGARPLVGDKSWGREARAIVGSLQHSTTFPGFGACSERCSESVNFSQMPLKANEITTRSYYSCQAADLENVECQIQEAGFLGYAKMIKD